MVSFLFFIIEVGNFVVRDRFVFFYDLIESIDFRGREEIRSIFWRFFFRDNKCFFLGFILMIRIF